MTLPPMPLTVVAAVAAADLAGATTMPWNSASTAATLGAPPPMPMVRPRPLVATRVVVPVMPAISPTRRPPSGPVALSSASATAPPSPGGGCGWCAGDGGAAAADVACLRTRPMPRLSRLNRSAWLSSCLRNTNSAATSATASTGIDIQAAHRRDTSTQTSSLNFASRDRISVQMRCNRKDNNKRRDITKAYGQCAHVCTNGLAQRVGGGARLTLRWSLTSSSIAVSTAESFVRSR